MTFTCPKCNMERTSLDCVPCLAQKLTDAYVEQKKRADEAVALLAEIQWRGEANTCPLCGENDLRPVTDERGRFMNHIDGAHDEGCRLAALIGKAGA